MFRFRLGGKMKTTCYLRFCGAAILSLAFASPSAATCVRPSGEYAGQGGGSVVSVDGKLLGAQTERWSLTFPTFKNSGVVSMSATVRMALPGAPLGGILELFNGTTYPFDETKVYSAWDPTTCSGVLRGVGGWASFGSGKILIQRQYSFTSADNGRVVTLALGYDAKTSEPYFPAYVIRLEKQ
jgi:hypothetical protein